MSGAQRLDEVKDPVSRAKLEGIQQSSQAIDLEIVKARKALDATRALAGATDLIAKRLFQECGPIKDAVAADQMASEEAKIRIEVITSNIQVVQGMQADARNDIATQLGVLNGLDRAQKITEEKFNVEAQKYERWERIQAEEAAEDALAAADEASSRPVSKKRAHKKAKAKRKGR